ncbi:MAG TPA: thioredoxin domain-containing protein [Gemmatimonadaceae bacterium]|nr:thioredoxin domain-containing protein [Gemmatimonadaceae bacterium]
MANRLAHETSPYLRQHADNPVDWYAWSPEAFERARREDKPILLSVGYAACHWCHVMAHESFEDTATATIMNEQFVNIKVDREERPDVDGIYMQAVQAMTGHGGWPMTMFLTPAGEPFYGGTYFPPRDRHGLPAFTRVLRSVSEAYRSRRGELEESTRRLRELYDVVGATAEATGEITAGTLDRAYQSIAARYDSRNGGFEGAPKFPMAMVLDFALRHAHRAGHATPTIALESFRHMARGGIYDQLGGGFHRYTVDAIWLVPHFEKMLYDNALLARLGVHLWQATGDAEVRGATERTLDWVAREMTDPNGGFYASLDADSAGGEGTFYIWTADEIDSILGPDAPAFKAYYGVTAHGNFEGANILHVAIPDASPPVTAREKVFARRARRERPARDEKILASWNGLMLRALADAARAFGRADYHAQALANGEFLARTMVRPDGRVMRSHAFGVTKIDGFLEDHAAVALGFIGLYELTFDERWLAQARSIAKAIDVYFWDESHRAFFDTAVDADPLIVRPKDVTDNATPSGTSLTTALYLHLAELTGDAALRERADWVLSTLAESMTTHAPAFGFLLGAADTVVHGALQVALAGDAAALANVVATTYIPSLVLAGGTADVELLQDRPAIGGRPTAYVCRGFVCDRPVTGPKELRDLLAHD